MRWRIMRSKNRASPSSSAASSARSVGTPAALRNACATEVSYQQRRTCAIISGLVVPPRFLATEKPPCCQQGGC